jgi:hypothetical protein
MFGGALILTLDVMVRTSQDSLDALDTFIELLEWNPFSQLSLIGFMNGLFLFCLGLMVDRRGA